MQATRTGSLKLLARCACRNSENGCGDRVYSRSVGSPKQLTSETGFRNQMHIRVPEVMPLVILHGHETITIRQPFCSMHHSGAWFKNFAGACLFMAAQSSSPFIKAQAECQECMDAALHLTQCSPAGAGLNLILVEVRRAVHNPTFMTTCVRKSRVLARYQIGNTDMGNNSAPLGNPSPVGYSASKVTFYQASRTINEVTTCYSPFAICGMASAAGLDCT